MTQVRGFEFYFGVTIFLWLIRVRFFCPLLGGTLGRLLNKQRIPQGRRGTSGTHRTGSFAQSDPREAASNGQPLEHTVIHSSERSTADFESLADRSPIEREKRASDRAMSD